MCTRPIKGFQLGINPENGKNILKIMPYHIDHIHFDGNKWKGMNFPIDNPGPNDIVDFIEIPCGKCPDCLLGRSREWANRCALELQYHDSSAFVTLTYNDEKLPKSEIIDANGEIIEHATLVKKHMAEFMKALRQEYAKISDNKLRFFGCGEYGSKTMRPHYHIIIFGLKFPKDDLTLYKKNFRGDALYNSAMLSKVWDKGHVVVGEVTWESCAYTARYILKKKFGKDADLYTDLGIQPEFINMSRKPGIARQYYEDHPELFDSNTISITTGKGGRDIHPPKYFERLYEADFPDEAIVRKEKRRVSAEENKELVLMKTSLNYLDYLEQKEYNIVNRLKKLPREEM